MIEKDYDIVIIGSGAGGGTVAKELSPLCRDGVRIAVLEWGPKLREEEYTGREIDMAGRLYIDSGGFVTADRTMTIAMGRAYGGSTVVYTGTSVLMRRETLEDWGVAGIEHDDLMARCRKYMEDNNVHLMESDKINDNNWLFREACEKLGYGVEQFPVNVKGCRGSGLCNMGCPNSAKQGTHRVQLPQAERNGVEVITNCRVERIEERAAVATVEARDFGHDSPWEPGRYRVSAKTIVLAAGAVHTPALLMRSKLPVALPALGRNFTAHPALILVGQHTKSITNFYGFPKSYLSEHFVDSHGFLIETCMYFPFVTAKSLSGFGAEHSRLMAHMDRLQMVLVLAIDPPVPENRVAIDGDGNPVVHYRIGERVIAAFIEAMRVSARILFAAGVERVHAPACKSFLIERRQRAEIDTLITRREFKLGKVSIVSAHPMGGCAMGSEPTSSVTDAWGEVHGLPWLFIADASLFPRCSGVNPYLTIMGLADRVAERVRARAPELLAA